MDDGGEREMGGAHSRPGFGTKKERPNTKQAAQRSRLLVSSRLVCSSRLVSSGQSKDRMSKPPNEEKKEEINDEINEEISSNEEKKGGIKWRANKKTKKYIRLATAHN